jgi:hypothetical protein
MQYNHPGFFNFKQDQRKGKHSDKAVMILVDKMT